MTTQSKKPLAKKPLEPGVIARAALKLIDREGLEACSMRRLGAELGVEAMSLYHHLPDKEALLDAVMELLVAQVEIPAEGPWETRMRRALRSHREVALRHPRAYILLLTRPYRTTPLLDYCERLAAMVAALGLGPKGSARAFRLVGHWLDGALLYASAGPARKTQPAVPPPTPLDPARHAHLAAIAPHLARGEAEAHFEFGMERILAELKALSASSSPA